MDMPPRRCALPCAVLPCLQPVLDTSTLLQLTPPKYKVTPLPVQPAPPPGQPSAHQQAALSPHQQEQLLIEQAVAAAAAFRAVAAEASGLPPGSPAQPPTAAAAANGHADGCLYGPWKPFMAPLLVNMRVTSAEHFQETRVLKFDLSGSGLQYQPGDLLAIFPRTPAADVEVRGCCRSFTLFSQVACITVLCLWQVWVCHAGQRAGQLAASDGLIVVVITSQLMTSGTICVVTSAAHVYSGYGSTAGPAMMPCCPVLFVCLFAGCAAASGA